MTGSESTATKSIRIELDPDRVLKRAAVVVGAAAVGYFIATAGPKAAVAAPVQDQPNQSGSPVVGDFGPGVSFQDYCQQVAVSHLISRYHEITDEEVRFMRDPREPGNAIQQFAVHFGGAISSRVSPAMAPSRNYDIRYEKPGYRPAGSSAVRAGIEDEGGQP